jgi:hypothetical protein
MMLSKDELSAPQSGKNSTVTKAAVTRSVSCFSVSVMAARDADRKAFEGSARPRASPPNPGKTRHTAPAPAWDRSPTGEPADQVGGRAAAGSKPHARL